MNQKNTWNSIAEEWHEFKQKIPLHTEEFLKKQKGKILDLGSGSGRNLMKIKNGKMYLVDFSEKMIGLAKQKAEEKKIPAEFYVSGMTKLPFKDNFFDGAIAIASLHCIKGKKQIEKTIKELNRVLKKNALVKISVWNKNSKRFEKSDKEKLIAWRDKGKRYYYLFTAEEIYSLFEKNSFRIKEKETPSRNIVFTAQKIQ